MNGIMKAAAVAYVPAAVVGAAAEPRPVRNRGFRATHITPCTACNFSRFAPRDFVPEPSALIGSPPSSLYQKRRNFAACALDSSSEGNDRGSSDQGSIPVQVQDSATDSDAKSAPPPEEKKKGLAIPEYQNMRFGPGGVVDTSMRPDNLPEVEILTGNMNTGKETAYKPLVSTWGLFERPSDISKSYGGGRNIEPGQPLESEEATAARQQRVARLMLEYRKSMGMDLSEEDREECQQLCDNAAVLMDRGKLRDAIDMFDKVLEKAPLKHQLGGEATLQKAICLDSLCRGEEAQKLYKTLTNHPVIDIQKKANRLLFGFKAMEKLKVTSQPSDMQSLRVYKGYLDKFANPEPAYRPEQDGEEDPVDGLSGILAATMVGLPVIFTALLVFFS
eukprot:jgi/Mesvir1/26977/Mv20690-RA.1